MTNLCSCNLIILKIVDVLFLYRKLNTLKEEDDSVTHEVGNQSELAHEQDNDEALFNEIGLPSLNQDTIESLIEQAKKEGICYPVETDRSKTGNSLCNKFFEIESAKEHGHRNLHK